MDKYHVLYDHRENTWTVIEKTDKYFVTFVSNVYDQEDAQKIVDALNAKEANSE